MSRPFAVVTGGSNGIGLELAREFASNGYDVLIAAENEANLAEAKRQLNGDGAAITTHAADLSNEQGVESLLGEIDGKPVDALCVNAGVGLGGPFVETDLQRELKMIDLNCRGAVQLTKQIATEMARRGEGKILVTSSIAATMPDPFEAVYGGTKAFLRWFGHGLREELKDQGVSVTVLMPSTTETNFFKRANMMDTRAGTMKKDDPATVAKAGFDALMRGSSQVVPTFKNRAMAAIADVLPGPIAAKLHRPLSEPGGATKQNSGSGSGLMVLGALAALGVGLYAASRRREAYQS